MPDERIRDRLENERRRHEPREPSSAGEPAPGDRVRLHHRRQKGFGDDRTVEGTLISFGETTLTIELDGYKLGVRIGDLTAWEWTADGHW